MTKPFHNCDSCRKKAKKIEKIIEEYNEEN